MKNTSGNRFQQTLSYVKEMVPALYTKGKNMFYSCDVNMSMFLQKL